jgi:hypothetical protein
MKYGMKKIIGIICVIIVFASCSENNVVENRDIIGDNIKST